VALACGRDEKHRRQVYRKKAIPCIHVVTLNARRKTHERSAVKDTGVVRHHVRRPVVLAEARGSFRHVGRIGDVALNPRHGGELGMPLRLLNFV
jgi:hypothetical protein